jgi:sarcosine/dimethylglycine N-methyltransferase
MFSQHVQMNVADKALLYEEARRVLVDGGRLALWDIVADEDRTDQAAPMMHTLLTLPPSPIGLQAFVPNFERKAKNLTTALADGRLRAVQGVARAL